MLIPFSQTTSQGARCLHTVPLPLRRRPPLPPGTDIGTLTIRNFRGSGLAQAILAVERGGLDLWSLTETSRTEACTNNRRGHDVRHTAACLHRTDGAQGGMGMGAQDPINGRVKEATRFYRMNVASCERVHMVSAR